MLLQVCELWVLSALRYFLNCCPPKLPPVAIRFRQKGVSLQAGRICLSLAVSDILLAYTGFFTTEIFFIVNTAKKSCSTAWASPTLGVWNCSLEHTAKFLLNWWKNSPSYCQCCFCPWVIIPSILRCRVLVQNQLRYLSFSPPKDPQNLIVLLRSHQQLHWHSWSDFYLAVTSEVFYCEAMLEVVQKTSTEYTGEATDASTSHCWQKTNSPSALATEFPSLPERELWILLPSK